MTKDRLKQIIFIIFIIINLFSFVVCIYLCYIFICFYYNIKHKTTPSSVEERRIERLQQNNKDYINEINVIDSIKHEKVIAVKNLNNDSTLMLFYKLISK